MFHTDQSPTENVVPHVSGAWSAPLTLDFLNGKRCFSFNCDYYNNNLLVCPSSLLSVLLPKHQLVFETSGHANRFSCFFLLKLAHPSIYKCFSLPQTPAMQAVTLTGCPTTQFSVVPKEHHEAKEAVHNIRSHISEAKAFSSRLWVPTSSTTFIVLDQFSQCLL